jgi:hypothetical protein
LRGLPRKLDEQGRGKERCTVGYRGGSDLNDNAHSSRLEICKMVYIHKIRGILYHKLRLPTAN